MILSYTRKIDNTEVTKRKIFNYRGDAVKFIFDHPELSNYKEIQIKGSVNNIDSVKSQKRVQNARLKTLFAGKSFEEELEAPSTWTYTKKAWDQSQHVIDYTSLIWLQKEYPLAVTSSVDGTEYSDEVIEENIKKYEEVYFKKTGNKAEFELKTITDDDTDKIVGGLLSCTPEYWGSIADEARKGTTVEALYLFFCSRSNFNWEYEDITYTGIAASLPYRITDWNIKMILEALSVYKFKPFWCQAGDKLIKMAPKIPAFTEEQARHILKKRLYQGSSVVLDGEVFYKPGLLKCFTESFPYDDFSLEKGLGLKFTKLPDIESLEIESTERCAGISNFFIAPFCRSEKTIVFKDTSRKEFVEHPDLAGEENYQIDFPLHCYPLFPATKYKFANIAFFHLFAEELGLKANVDDYYYFSKYTICEQPCFRGETREERIKRAEAPRKAIQTRIAEKKAKEAKEAEEKARAEAAERARIAEEKARAEAERKAKEIALKEDNDRKRLLETNVGIGRPLTVSTEIYGKTLERYISDHGINKVPVLANGNSRLYKYFFDNRDNKELMDKYPESWTLAALYFFYGIDLKCYMAAEDVNEKIPVYKSEYDNYVEMSKTFIKENNISYSDFCWFMSSLNSVFNILPLKDRRRRLQFGMKWANNLPDSVYHFMHFFLLNWDRPELSSLISKCGLSWLEDYDKVYPIRDEHNKKILTHNVDGLEYMKNLLLRCAFPMEASKKLKKDFYKETTSREKKGFLLKGKMFVEGYIPVMEMVKGKNTTTWKESIYDFEINGQKTAALPYSKIRGLVNILNKSVLSFLTVFDTLEKKEVDTTVLSQSIIDLYKQYNKEEKTEFSKIVIPTGDMTYKDFKTAYPKFVELCNVTYDSGEYNGTKGPFKKWSMRALGYTSPTWASWRKLLKDNKSLDGLKEKARRLRTASRIRWGSAVVIIAGVITWLASVN